jgi:peptidoglycan-associated lipoprotein
MRQLIFTTLAVMLWSAMALAQSAARLSPDDSGSQVTPPPYSLPSPEQQQQLQQNAKDVHFDFDRYDLKPEDQQSLQQTANWLKANPSMYVAIAGDADERGEIVYNLALSDKRAQAARDALVSMGVPANQIVFATGWGKLYPTCTQSDESCWSQNRRAHFELW